METGRAPDGERPYGVDVSGPVGVVVVVVVVVAVAAVTGGVVGISTAVVASAKPPFQRLRSSLFVFFSHGTVRPRLLSHFAPRLPSHLPLALYTLRGWLARLHPHLLPHSLARPPSLSSLVVLCLCAQWTAFVSCWRVNPFRKTEKSEAKAKLRMRGEEKNEEKTLPNVVGIPSAFQGTEAERSQSASIQAGKRVSK